MTILEQLLGPKIKCDSCAARFRPTLEDEVLPGGTIRRGFKCPRCAREYPVAEITPRGQRLIQELQDVELGSIDATQDIVRLRKAIKREVTDRRGPS